MYLLPMCRITLVSGERYTHDTDPEAIPGTVFDPAF